MQKHTVGSVLYYTVTLHL